MARGARGTGGDRGTGDGVLVRIKAVPGAKRDEIVGMLGDRLKVRVSAPPEGGKANRAICGLIAAALGVRAADVEVVRGASSAEKVVRVKGADTARVRGLGAGGTGAGGPGEEG